MPAVTHVVAVPAIRVTDDRKQALRAAVRLLPRDWAVEVAEEWEENEVGTEAERTPRTGEERIAAVYDNWEKVVNNFFRFAEQQDYAQCLKPGGGAYPGCWLLTQDARDPVTTLYSSLRLLTQLEPLMELLISWSKEDSAATLKQDVLASPRQWLKQPVTVPRVTEHVLAAVRTGLDAAGFFEVVRDSQNSLSLKYLTAKEDGTSEVQSIKLVVG